MIWLRNATLADGRRVDVGIEGSRIAAVAAVSPVIGGGGVSMVDTDLSGYLLVPTPAEPHAHLDKALTADIVPNPSGELVSAINAWLAYAPHLTIDDMATRARAAALELIAAGVTAVRTHTNVYAGWLDAVEALVRVRHEMHDLIDIEIVCLTTMQLCDGEAGYRSMLKSAMALDPAVIVGGCPHLDENDHRAIDVALELAGEAGRPLDLHTDEQLDTHVLGLRHLARRVRETGFPHGATASHCVSLGMQTAEVQRVVAEETAAAGVAVVTLPQTNLFLQGRGFATSPPRGLTALRPLLAAGATLAAGADNVRDPFNLVGRSDPFETAALLVMAGHLTVAEAFAAVTSGARKAMGLPSVDVVAGAPAELLAVRASSLGDAVARADLDRLVWHSGKLVARTSVRREYPGLKWAAAGRLNTPID